MPMNMSLHVKITLRWLMTVVHVGQRVQFISELIFFFVPNLRTPRTAAKPGSWFATSTKAAVTAVSSITLSTASWSPTAPSAPSSWSPKTGAMPRAAGSLSSKPSASHALTDREPPQATGQVRSVINNKLLESLCCGLQGLLAFASLPGDDDWQQWLLCLVQVSFSCWD